MNKALLIYDFNGKEKKNIKIPTINIGDYTQTIAAIGIVDKKPDYSEYGWINREEFKNGVINKKKNGVINKKKNKEFKVISNGWFMHSTNSFKIPKNIKPLFISVHIKNESVLSPPIVKEFKKFEPIGCRDLNTVDLFLKYGVKAYFSGCLTMTIKERKVKREDLTFVLDTITIEGKWITTYEQFKKWKMFDFVVSILKKEGYSLKDIKNATYLSQNSKLTDKIEDQFIFAEEMLDKLAKSKLVVTTRIHTLMPSMSMGTTSLFLMMNNKDKRFGGLSDFWNYLDLTKYKTTLDKNDIISHVSYNEGKIINNNDFRNFIKSTKKIVSKWWEEN